MLTHEIHAVIIIRKMYWKLFPSYLENSLNSEYSDSIFVIHAKNTYRVHILIKNY